VPAFAAGCAQEPQQEFWHVWQHGIEPPTPPIALPLIPSPEVIKATTKRRSQAAYTSFKERDTQV
jgi:hypothetical protein